MEINSGLNQPVTFFTKNTGNSINTIVDNENYPSFSTNVFTAELNEKRLNNAQKIKRRRKSKRLNTIDSDYLPDEAIVENIENQDDSNNFFLAPEENKFKKNFKKAINYLFENIPLVNYIYLRRKTAKIQKTVEELNDITQNVDELLNTAVPYGEEKELYSSFAKNLTDAATIMGRAQKNI